MKNIIEKVFICSLCCLIGVFFGTTIEYTKAQDDSSNIVDFVKDLKIGWNAPTTRTDESPLSLSEIKGYRVALTSSNHTSPNENNIVNSMIVECSQEACVQALADMRETLPDGLWVAWCQTIDTMGNESDWERLNENLKLIKIPPSNVIEFKVVIEGTATLPQ